ncbi:MAG: DUF58 domain-containing protein [Planctomycetota bacterium]
MRRTRSVEPVVMDARQLELKARELANSMVFGLEESTFHGAGIEYAQPRPYVDGDSVKFIDWKVTGRTGKYHVKEYQEPKRMPVYILFDTSASMCVSSSTHVSKYSWGLCIATGLALAAQAKMSPVGLLGCGANRFHIKPTLSGRQVMQWAHQLRRHGYLESTAFGRRLRELAPSLRVRTMIIAVTDLHDPDGVPAMKWVGQEHDCIMLHLQDAAEQGLRGCGLFRGQEAETGTAFVAHGRTNWDRSDEAKRALTRSGVEYLRLRTDERIIAKLQLLMRMRGPGSSGGR